MNSLTIKAILATFVGGVILSCGGGGGGGATNQPPAQPPPPGSDGSYYVDCSAPTNGNATQDSPWNTLSSVNALTLTPGNQVLLKRGMTCQGTLNPLGSGSSAARIIVDAYGTGTQPVINGGTNNAVVTLTDQQYWEIRNLEIVGGNRFGIFIGGNTPNSALNHFHLINLNVHGANFTTNEIGSTGEVYFGPAANQQVFNDVLIDGANVHDSNVSEGIHIEAGGNFNGEITACQQQPVPAQDLGGNVTVQNSTVHDVYGNGILILALNNGLMQNNVVYNSGLCPSCSGTPSGLWEWCCHSCTIQNNESYANRTGGLYDGGDFDIDQYSEQNVLQFNYGHDSDGYCVQVGATGLPAVTDNAFRYNICSNNGRNSVITPQGDVMVEGDVNGVQVYNNTFYWNPAVNSGALLTKDNGGTDIRIFKNNIVYSTVPQVIQAYTGYTFDNNIYWTTGIAGPTWQWNNVTYTSFSAYQSASGQDAHSYYTDPLLNNPTYHAAGRSSTAFTLQTGSPARGTGTNVCLGISGCSMGTQDFFGNPLPNGSGYDIGANQAPQ